MTRLLTLLFFCGLSFAQDCSLSISRSTAGASSAFDNRSSGCLDWTLEYTSQGFTALSIQLESAPDANGSPGTWVPFGGSVSVSNPLTNPAQGNSGFSGFFPWVRVNLISVTGTGTVTGLVFGKKPPTAVPSIQAGGSGGLCQNGPQPTAIAPPLGVFASGLTQIIAAVPGKAITVCNLLLAFQTAVNVQLEYGTGTNCGTGTTQLSGVFPNVITFASDAPTLVPVGQAVCANLNQAVVGGGLGVYAAQ